MSGSESPILEQKQNPSGQSSLPLESEGKSQFVSVSDRIPNSKVSKSGASDGEESYTVFSDNAQNKNNEQMINSNDPPADAETETFQQNEGPAQAPRVDLKGQQCEVPQFGASAYFENKRKDKNGEPTASQNDPKMNRDLHPRKDPPAEARPAPAKPVPQQEARSKVSQFGTWEGAGEAGHTQSFENVRKNNKNGRTVTPEPSNAPQLNRDVNNTPTKEGRPKVPQFGAWKEGDNDGVYTAYFENARKYKAGPVLDPVEPQLNRDVNNRAQSPTARTKYKADDYQLRKAGERRAVLWAKSGNLRSQTSSLDCKGESNELVNWARIPLLNEGMLAERAGALARADDPHVYGGSISLTTGKMGGNGNDVDQFGITSRVLPVSRARSKTAYRKEIKLLQRNQGAKKSQVSITNAGMILNNDTPESYHLPTHHSNKKGSCFPWFGRRGVKSFSFLKQ
ncbi:uncharacterized protein LOC104899541 isoform X2 [Beta vulgaris subsp. vulgaris]|uniref:uncharacterized protein LOC104899541 isoform X2 n=1 Tax=Beta vulgaris subsp. vulgaris TaxID=3555 RepID=UPI0020374FD0|nr:uncharacterized protein LOC104899541 isoform X2 [Beta vulgaris subsp. vulgaris]